MKLWHDERGYIMQNLNDLVKIYPREKQDGVDPGRSGAGCGETFG